MANNIANYKGTVIHIITERLYSRGAPNWNGIGASMVQVYKMVYQLYQKQDVYLEEKRITPDTVTLWQRLKILSGAHLFQRNSSDHSNCFSLDYAGSRFMATPLSSFDSKKIPTFLTKEYSLPTRRILALGRDPFPQVNIYGRQDAHFVMASGGKDDPIAAAKYDSNTRQLVLVDPGQELSSLMRLLSTQRVL